MLSGHYEDDGKLFVAEDTLGYFNTTGRLVTVGEECLQDPSVEGVKLKPTQYPRMYVVDGDHGLRLKAETTELDVQNELEAFARATALPHARKQVMETLTVGLCLSTGTCKPEDVRGGEQFSLSPLKTVLQEAREAVTPGFIEEAVEFWQGTGVAVGALGGWLVLMFITVQMARWVSTATKVRITGWWRRCWEPVQAAQEPEHRPRDPEAGAPRLYPIPQFQVEGIRDQDMKM